jgi:hypothetical protein
MKYNTNRNRKLSSSNVRNVKRLPVISIKTRSKGVFAFAQDVFGGLMRILSKI